MKNLKAAAAGENEEWTELYPEFAKVAREEGFEAIAITFERISEVEKRHEARYNKLAKNIEEGKVFKKDEKVLWKCLNCGIYMKVKKRLKYGQHVYTHKDTLKYLLKHINIDCKLS